MLHIPNDGVTTKITNRTKLQLANALRDEAGIAVDPLRPMNEIKQFGIRHRVDLQNQKAPITEGWLKRGWIDLCQCTIFKQDKTAGKIVYTLFYTINGQKDMQNGQIPELSSLRALMGQYTDFKEGQTAMQFLGKQFGLRVLFTPKFHCDLLKRVLNIIGLMQRPK